MTITLFYTYYSIIMSSPNYLSDKQSVANIFEKNISRKFMMKDYNIKYMAKNECNAASAEFHFLRSKIEAS